MIRPRPVSILANRRGFTLAELMIATVVMGILGIALTRILINDSRFVSKVEAMMNARQAARAAMNTMGVELRMVGEGGLIAASQRRIRAQVPYAFGLLCDPQGLGRYAVLVPTDSMTYAQARHSGLAWRADDGAYTTMRVADVIPSGMANLDKCTTQGIDTLPGGMFIQFRALNDTMPTGAVFYLYQNVTYRFAASVDLPGRQALWRNQPRFPIEEILAPFDLASGFGFYVGTSDTAQATPPADLSTVTGLELRLIGASDFTPQGTSAPPSFDLRTRVNFLNKQP